MVCRFRPFNQKEKDMGAKTGAVFENKQALQLNLTTVSILIFPHQLFLPQDQASSSAQPHKFNFDHIFDMNSTQKEVYDSAAKPIIDSVLEGFNGTIFAYG